MANGRGTRWGEYLGTSKHLLQFHGETLLRRIVRQLSEQHSAAEIIISSSNPEYETEGAVRHSPLQNQIELDRFVPELITDDVCFLYGDTYYEDSAIESIVSEQVSGLRFFGDDRAIVAVKSADAKVLSEHLGRVRELYLSGRIEKCIGWQLYQSYANLPFGPGVIDREFTRLTNQTNGFNTPEDYQMFVETTVEYAGS